MASPNTLISSANNLKSISKAKHSHGTLWLLFLALLGIVFSPYFCVKFSPPDYQTENSRSIIGDASDGKTVQIPGSICGVHATNNPTQSSHEDQKLTKSCFYCLLTNTGGLLPHSAAENSFIVNFLNITSFNDPFIITQYRSDSRSRAPPLKLSFIV